MSRPRPPLVKVELRALHIGEEFTSADGDGVVVDWGHVLERDRTGRETRVRSVLVRFGTVEAIMRADTVVLVPWTRPHVRFDPAREDARWTSRLRRPNDPKVVAKYDRRYRLRGEGVAC